MVGTGHIPSCLDWDRRHVRGKGKVLPEICREAGGPPRSSWTSMYTNSGYLPFFT